MIAVYRSEIQKRYILKKKKKQVTEVQAPNDTFFINPNRNIEHKFQ